MEYCEITWTSVLDSGEYLNLEKDRCTIWRILGGLDDKMKNSIVLVNLQN